MKHEYTYFALKNLNWLNCMKLILHAGTHKTATTQFQDICYLNYDLLSRSGLLYPKVELLPDNPGIIKFNKGKSFAQHSFLQRLAVKNDVKSIFQFFRDSFQQAKRLNCKCTLCSGEDLESALVDISVFKIIETEAQSAGYDEIEWIFVKRKSIDYYSSLYSQLSRQSIVCDPLTLLEAIENHGYFTVTNSVGVFHYVFDIIYRIKKLKKAASGSIRMISFEKFIEDDFAGKSFIFELIDQKTINSLRLKDCAGSLNESLSDLDREAGYLLAYCNIARTSENYNLLKEKFDFFVKRRMEVFAHCLEQAQQTLSKFD